MSNRRGKIRRSYDGCRWRWTVWIDDEFFKNGVEDTLVDAIDAVLKLLKNRGD